MRASNSYTKVARSRSTDNSRRRFVKQSAVAGIGISALGHIPAVYGQNSPSQHITVAVMGVNSRGDVLAQTFAQASGAEVAYVCDVDSRVVEKTMASVANHQQRTPQGIGDFRRALDDDDVDALVIAAPDHWHAPATLLALQAGKHVYVEKPCGHNAREGELLAEGQHTYDRIVQMGNQQRSAPRSIEIIGQIHDGLIGRPYFARAWFASTRGSIGHGRAAGVPDWLDYELWQGPAPRTSYRDNVVHYNWHWFWRWGTGEINNNGAHEIDVCRWALNVDYPSRVTSAGGRFHFDDDVEMYDTQVASFEFAGGKSITWEGRSCNGRPIEGRGRGVSIHGEEGTVIIDRSGYVVYDRDNNEVKRSTRSQTDSALNTRAGGDLTALHINNFLESIRGNAQPNAPVDDGQRSVLLCHLGNIAQRTGSALHCDPSNGHVINNPEAMDYWGREYEPGWEPKVSG
ncbi:MAG: dehydrogenase [Acidobacteria bacterium]|jgi:predicted dehydrogenase|uniref:Gfo/Idh/MocA-like oxidoreductase N-terminal domain-containing protein n=1 Tax=marine metagenome TaxID=408172 RepID=A0A381XZK8_9ZZZZ|nr:dehydrogenase [Acidobacteriota bacterium]|tara:strand:+ start:1454 stop:2827 length:1374 start_codon:yes stop_codon:yes gene_type:complete